MIDKNLKAMVEKWFQGLNDEDLKGLMELFHADVVIRNAANPPLAGPEAPRQLLEDFFDRTVGRSFELLGMAQGDRSVFAHWEAELTFRPGIRIGDVIVRQFFTVRLKGVDRFLFENGKISALDIVHETTSVPIAAEKSGQLVEAVFAEERKGEI